MQQMLKQACSGTILTSINKDTLLDLPIPLINPELQTQIAQYVQQSFALQQQSKQLLALAKQAVEVAIEQNEAAALALMAQQQL
jgi:type I restriction enzyme S subunit